MLSDQYEQPSQNHAEIIRLQDQLTGALIGLARAAAGNEDLVTSRTCQLVREALAATPGSAEVTRDVLLNLLARTAAEKATLAPNCANCDHPCGKTADYDMASLWNAPEDVRSLKVQILLALRGVAASGRADEAADAFLLRMLESLGNEWDIEDLQAFARKAAGVHQRLVGRLPESP